MPIIKLEYKIEAPIERVFDLARCIDLHEKTMTQFNEKAIAGVTQGLINPGECVTWEATHFGIRQKLTSKITEFNRPYHFQDKMIKGAFRSFTHDHFFEEIEPKIFMRDIFEYKSPYGILGKIADSIFLEEYMTKMLKNRNNLIKSIAEGKDWKRFIVF